MLMVRPNCSWAYRWCARASERVLLNVRKTLCGRVERPLPTESKQASECRVLAEFCWNDQLTTSAVVGRIQARPDFASRLATTCCLTDSVSSVAIIAS